MAYPTECISCDETKRRQRGALLREDWLGRWVAGRTGWHEPDGNSGLKRHWPDLPAQSRVLVPLCGKSADLLWLARRGHTVVGVELSEIAVRAFFSDHQIEFNVIQGQSLDCFTARDLSIELYCGDYFEFTVPPCDALYDRGALVALPGELRPVYVAHTNTLLKDHAFRFIVTLEYEQSVVSGPPFSVPEDELKKFWNGLKLVEARDDIENCPPKFRAAGLQHINESFWVSSR
jgi:thiopurine S-methyltransferase